MAKWKRAGHKTQRSVDQNYLLLIFFENFRNKRNRNTYLKSTKKNPAKFTLHCLRTTKQDLEFSSNCNASRMARWKRTGPITHRSVDRNYLLLIFFQDFRREKKSKQSPHKSTRENPARFKLHCLRRATKPGRQFS